MLGSQGRTSVNIGSGYRQSWPSGSRSRVVAVVCSGKTQVRRAIYRHATADSFRSAGPGSRWKSLRRMMPPTCHAGTVLFPDDVEPQTGVVGATWAGLLCAASP
jgi:hypothetical protein